MASRRATPNSVTVHGYAHKLEWPRRYCSLSVHDDIADLDAGTWRPDCWARPARHAPSVLFSAKASAIAGGASEFAARQSQPRVTWPLSLIFWTTNLTVLRDIEGDARADPPDGEKIAVLTPITSPLAVEGRPARISDIHRCVDCKWIRPISRPRADTIPAVTVPPNRTWIADREHPIADTHTNSVLALIFSSARCRVPILA